MSIGTLLYVRDVVSNINEQLIKFLSATADRIKYQCNKVETFTEIRKITYY